MREFDVQRSGYVEDETIFVNDGGSNVVASGKFVTKNAVKFRTNRCLSRLGVELIEEYDEQDAEPMEVDDS